MNTIRLVAWVLVITLLPMPVMSAVTRIPDQPYDAVYYVDNAHPQANDNNPGTEVLPWKTMF